MNQMHTFQAQLATANNTSNKQIKSLAKLTKLSLEEITKFKSQYIWNMWPA